jgi:hypothetical protein
MSTLSFFQKTIVKIGAGILALIGFFIIFFLSFERIEYLECQKLEENKTAVSYQTYFFCAQYEIFLPLLEQK